MKVKCPICKKILVDYTVHALAIHIHEHDKDEISDELAEKIFKIHEKIEELENCIAMNKQDKYFPLRENKIMEVVSQELKSLLENKK